MNCLKKMSYNKLSSLSSRERCVVLLRGFIFSCLAAYIFAGCGYHFQSGEKPMGIDIKSIAIPLMESTSSSLGFESDFTGIVREEFASHTKIPLVSRDEASAVLIGKIVEIRTKALGYDLLKSERSGEEYTYEVTESRRLYIELDAKLIDRATGNIIWSDRGMKERASYDVTSDPMTNRHNQREAVRKIARRFAERMFLKTIERF